MPSTTPRLSRAPLIAVLSLLVASSVSAQSTIRLYPGVAPGSEDWVLPEEVFPGTMFLPAGKDLGQWTFNVSVPTLTIFRPAPEKANGTAVIVVPGGAFHFLAGPSAEPFAQWLVDRGITAFVLKCRVVQTTPEHRKQLFAGPPFTTSRRTGIQTLAAARQPPGWNHLEAELPTIMPLDLADAEEALTYVRAHAAELGIAANRVGMLGGSAGAMIIVSLILTESDGPKPDFIAALYPGLPDWMRPVVVPKSAPPAFFAVASDDNVGFIAATTELYTAWAAAHRPAELHAYPRGNHGFGIIRQGLPVDTWTERFEDWLRFQGLLPPLQQGARQH